MSRPRSMDELNRNIATIIERRSHTDGSAAAARRRIDHHAATMQAVIDRAKNGASQEAHTMTKLYALRRFFLDANLDAAPLEDTKAGLAGRTYTELLAVRQGAYDFIALCDEQLGKVLDDEEDN